MQEDLAGRGLGSGYLPRNVAMMWLQGKERTITTTLRIKADIRMKYLSFRTWFRKVAGLSRVQVPCKDFEVFSTNDGKRSISG